MTLHDRHLLTTALRNASSTGGLVTALPTVAVAVTLLTGWGFGTR